MLTSGDPQISPTAPSNGQGDSTPTRAFAFSQTTNEVSTYLPSTPRQDELTTLLTPTKVSAAMSKITPTRLKQPPIRQPLTFTESSLKSPQTRPRIPKEPAPPTSPLFESRPTWNNDFHVNRKDYSKPKSKLNASSTPRPNGINSGPVNQLRGREITTVSPVRYSLGKRLKNAASCDQLQSSEATNGPTSNDKHMLLRSRSLMFEFASPSIAEAPHEDQPMPQENNQKRIAQLEAELHVKVQRISELETALKREKLAREALAVDFLQQKQCLDDALEQLSAARRSFATPEDDDAFVMASDEIEIVKRQFDDFNMKA
ncbi:hypothetical protein HK097_005586 [Rhizophlyctis rosea]|uniref:Uncharacterized protein n=1 Tax=Rhizophlyctis rosea TaxID=64517 RepID=A0AAD5X620_9FUNG|nr:hypothetical protein HK097_005586 [Rhizophlyctis rosea]